MIDTHCHLNFEAYSSDLAEVLQQADAAGITHIIIPGVDLESCEQALQLAGQHEVIFAASGIHPNSTADFNPETLAAVRHYAQQQKVVAIGEIGLDYYWDKSPRAAQILAFEAQLALASEMDLPVIIHNREASEDTMSILEQWIPSLPPSLRERPGVLHSFSASQDIAKRALAAGFYLGFTGPITFKKADDLRSIARQIPLDRILVETDGPFLTPEPYRGKRNQPAYVAYVIDRLAGLHGLPTEQMTAITTENALRLFHF